jgi:Domain of unknown function (DUF1793)
VRTQLLTKEKRTKREGGRVSDANGMKYRNQTNLALKGMIGIGAMAVISNLTGNTQEAQNYTTIANAYISQWLAFGIAYNDNPPHTTCAYEQGNTHGMS